MSKNKLASIVFDSGLFHAKWEPILNTASAIWRMAGLPLNEKGRISNSKLLERLFSIVDIDEYGAGPLLYLFYISEDIAYEQYEKLCEKFDVTPKVKTMMEQIKKGHAHQKEKVSDEEAQAILDGKEFEEDEWEDPPW